MPPPEDSFLRGAILQAKLVQRLLEYSVQSAELQAELQRSDGTLEALVSASCRALESQDADIAIAALQFLGEMARQSPRITGQMDEAVLKALSAIEVTLRHDNPSVRIASIKTIAAFGRHTPSRIAIRVIDKITDENGDVQRVAIDSIVSFGADLASAGVEQLVSAVASAAYPNVRQAAARTLGWLEADASKAIGPLLRVASSDPDSEVRITAARALVSIDANGDLCCKNSRSVIDNDQLLQTLRETGESGRLLRRRLEESLAEIVEFKTQQELADELGVSPRTVRRWRKSGKLPPKDDDGIYRLTREQILSLPRS